MVDSRRDSEGPRRPGKRGWTSGEKPQEVLGASGRPCCKWMQCSRRPKR